MTNENSAPNSKFWAKIVEAQSAITHIVPRQKVVDGPTKGHKYASKADVFSQIKSAIHSAGLAIIQSMEDCKTERYDVPDREGKATLKESTIVKLKFRIVDIVSGEECESFAFGRSVDSANMSDVGPQSAATSAIRQFYCDFFQAPVMEEANDEVPLATPQQKDKIKKLKANLQIDRDTWGNLMGMTSSEFRAPEEEYEATFAFRWKELKANRANDIIEQLEAMLMEKNNPTTKGTGTLPPYKGGRMV